MNDCMYLHELGDDLASFTKEQMQQGKHTEYEKNLHEEMLAGLAQSPPSPSPDMGCGLEGGEREADWSSQWVGRQGEPDQWGGRAGPAGEDWGGRTGSSDQSWPDLGPSLPNYKGRFITSNSKVETRDPREGGVVGGIGADAAWENAGVAVEVSTPTRRGRTRSGSQTTPPSEQSGQAASA